MEKLSGFVSLGYAFSIYDFFVCACSVYVIVRILSRELVLKFFRDWLLQKKYYWVHELFSCFFCLSIWVSGFAAFFSEKSFFLLVVAANFLNVLFFFLERHPT